MRQKVPRLTRVASASATVVTAVTLVLSGTAVASAGPRPDTGVVQARIKVAPGPVAEVGGYGAIWVISVFPNVLTRIDPTTNKVTGRLRLPIGPLSDGDLGQRPISAGSGGIWISCFFRDQVLRIDPVTMSIVQRIHVGRGPFDVTAAFGSVFVANWMSATVSRIDPATNKVVANIPVGNPKDFFGGPYGLDVLGKYLWATVPDSDAVSKIDPSTNQVTDIENVSPAAACGGLLPAPHGFWVNDTNCEDSMSRFDLRTHSVVASYQGGNAYCDIGGDVFNGFLYTTRNLVDPATGNCDKGGYLVKRDLLTGDVVRAKRVAANTLQVAGIDSSLWTSNMLYDTADRVIRVTPF